MLTEQSRRFVSHPSSPAHPAVVAKSERLEALNDEELLDRFLNWDDATSEAAFRAIVVRHGPMVLGVCRHVLNQLQDAEDAFQATFLVLARKASSIRDRRVLARWLYEVAYRIAMRAKTNSVRRRAHERQGGEMAATISFDNSGWIELKPVLHEEVNRLPEKYRVPVILCYLEGKTNEEVAQLLNWPVGTVKGRLSRARDLLRSRLTRRGLALSAALLVTALADGTVVADVVPKRLVDQTVSKAMTLVARKSAAPVAISPELDRLMDLAATPAWAYRAAVVALLVLVIVTALASLGLASGYRFESSPTVDSFLLPSPGRSSVTPAPSPPPSSPRPSAASASTGGCHAATP